MVNKKIIDKIVNDIDWNLWRGVYNKLTFEEQIEIYDRIIPKCRTQKGYDTDFFITSFIYIQQNGFDMSRLTVAELGSYTGMLAYECMSRMKIGKWLGFDISRWVVNHTLEEAKDLGFINNSLDDQFWNIKDLKFDIFVSSDTIEHLRHYEVKKLINFVSERALFLLLQINTKSKNESWNNYKGTHILELDIDEIIDIIEKKRFVLVRTIPTGTRKISGYRLLFRRIDSYKN